MQNIFKLLALHRPFFKNQSKYQTPPNSILHMDKVHNGRPSLENKSNAGQ